jgi:hypothetical protein
MSSASAWSSIPDTSAEVSSCPVPSPTAAALAIFIQRLIQFISKFLTMWLTSRVVSEGDFVGAVDV